MVAAATVAPLESLPQEHRASSLIDTMEIPQDYLCPISLELMTRPMIFIQSGHTYDFDSIDRWLSQAATKFKDPMTGLLMEDSVTLRPNFVLQQEIAEWCRQKGVEFAPKPWAKDGMQGSSMNAAGKATRETQRFWSYVGAVFKALRTPPRNRYVNFAYSCR